MITVGLVGGVASGKSTVARYFSTLGYGWVDGDACAHQALCLPHVKSAIQGRWGQSWDVFDQQGKVNRPVVAGIVFNNQSELSFLEDLLFQDIDYFIQQRMRSFIEAAGIIMDIPLLFEYNYHRLCDAVFFCHAERATRYRRFVERYQGMGCPPAVEDMDSRDNAHLSLEDRKQRASFIIDTEADLSAVQKQARELLDVVSNPTVFDGWSSGMLVAEASIHDAANFELLPDPSFVSHYRYVNRLKLQLKEELRRRGL